jgi:hypothetical protein
LNTFAPHGNLSSFSPKDMIVLQRKKYLSCSPRQFQLLFHKDMIIPREKKIKVVPQRQLKLLFPKDMIVPWGKPTSSGTMNFPRERFKFPRETYVLNFLTIIVIT